MDWIVLDLLTLCVALIGGHHQLYLVAHFFWFLKVFVFLLTFLLLLGNFKPVGLPSEVHLGSCSVSVFLQDRN